MRTFAIFLVLAVLLQEITADCSCYETGNYTGKSAPISNPYNTDDFSACGRTCSYVAYSGDDTYGWTGFTINWGSTTGSSGLIQIYDGLDTTKTPLIQVNEGENVLSGSTKSTVKSSSPVITIQYSQSGTAGNVFYGVIKAVPGLQPVTQPATTTAIPTTRSYSDTNFKKDPQLIAHDMLVVVNQRTSGGVTVLTNLKGIGYTFFPLLATTTDVNSASRTRLSLATLTPYNPYYAVQGEIWGLNSTTLLAGFPSSGISIEGNIDQALIGLVNLAFEVNQNTSTDSRPYAQRSVLLLTGEWPSTGATLDASVKTAFDERGVNLLVVGFKLNDTESNQLLRTDNRWYNAVNALDSKPTTVASFVNPFYFNDASQTNYWCPPAPVLTSNDGTFSYIQEPYNYIGPIGSGSKLNWVFPYNGENGRYCNFANNIYNYNNPDGVNLKVVVLFELEAGKDSLSFYDSSNTLIATFTGYDISGSTFYTTTTQLIAQYISDNQSVYRGFYVSITPQPA